MKQSTNHAQRSRGTQVNAVARFSSFHAADVRVRSAVQHPYIQIRDFRTVQAIQQEQVAVVIRVIVVDAACVISRLRGYGGVLWR